jgi:hypothetical protein
MEERWMGLRPVFFGPCTLVRTWGTIQRISSGKLFPDHNFPSLGAFEWMCP